MRKTRLWHSVSPEKRSRTFHAATKSIVLRSERISTPGLQTHVVALELKRPFQSHAYRDVFLYSFFIVFIMAGTDDIVPEVSFAQEEAD